jgi:hypothetical protein
MQPIQLGRMTVHKVHEMDSPTPMSMNLPGWRGGIIRAMTRSQPIRPRRR